MKSFSTTLANAPAFKVSVILTTGILLSRLLPEDPLVIPVCSIALAIAVSLSLILRRMMPGKNLTFCLAIGACLFMGSVKYLLDREHFPHSDDRPTRVVVLGTVISDFEVSGSRRNFVLRSDRIRRDSLDEAFRTDVAVSLIVQARDTVEPAIHYGNTIALYGMLERPPEERNPGEMSMRDYNEALGITHAIEVKGVRNVRIVGHEGGSWWMRRLIFPARRWMLQTLDQTTGGEEGELLKGLILGERGGMSILTKTAFVNAGVAHVLAVSGSNVAVVAGALLLFLEILRVPRSLRILPMLVGLLFYMLVTGSQPPVVRATIMAGVLLIGNALQRPVNAWNCIGLSAIIIAAIDARQIFDIGFQLSYGAVLSLMAMYPVMNGWIARMPQSAWWQRCLAWLLRVCAVSLAATLGTLPLTAVSFGRVSIIGVLANVVVVPATEFSVLLGSATLGAALASGWMAACYGAVNWLLLHWTLVITRLAGFSPVAYITTVWFGRLDALPYYAVLTSLFATSDRKTQHVILTLLALGVYVVLLRPAFNTTHKDSIARVSVIDVGQGDAILVELPDRTTLLIDAGPRTATFDAGERTVVPFLRRRGIASLDLLVVSHLHADHMGGFSAVAEGIDVHRVLVLSPCALRSTLGVLWPSHSPPCDSCVPARGIALSPLARLYVVYPLPGVERGSLGGNESIVLKLVYGSVSFLFCGDAEEPQEGLMVDRYGAFLASPFLKSGHHGSSTSSSERFLEAVRPTIAAVSVGLHNKFRHPSAAVIERYKNHGIAISRTDEEGALMFESDGRTVWKSPWR